MAKYRKKPLTIEAEQFWPTEWPWPDGVRMDNSHPNLPPVFSIETLEGRDAVTPGDWIITDTNGEKDSCKPDIFEETYEPVD